MTASLPRAGAPVPLRIEVSFPSPGTVRLAVAGEVDLATAPQLGVQLLAVMDAHRPAVVDVDLAAVGFLDCSGIGVLVAVRDTAEKVGYRVWISHPQPFVAKVLEAVGLLALFAAPIAPIVLPAPRSASSWTARTRVVRMARAMVGRIAA
jgi:anti-anti-sigma factor